MKTTLTPPPITTHWPNEGWTEHGGYDCMTAGIRVGPVVLDGMDYGQKQCANMTTKQRKHMEADAQFIAAAPAMTEALVLALDALESLAEMYNMTSGDVPDKCRKALLSAGYTETAE